MRDELKKLSKKRSKKFSKKPFKYLIRPDDGPGLAAHVISVAARDGISGWTLPAGPGAI
jgi:hypothetical protein